MTVPVRQYQVGENRASVAIANRPFQDLLTGSRYAADGSDYRGFPLPEHACPKVANQVARDALFPTPQPHQEVERLDTGYIERHDPTLGWVQDRPSGNAGPQVRVRSQGAKGDASTNDRDAFDRGNTAAGLSGELVGDPGTYHIDSALTLSAHWVPKRGCKVSPGPGVTIAVNGPVTAGSWQWMDFSRGGFFDYSQNPYVHEFLARWFGVAGDGSTAEEDALLDLVNCVPDMAHVRFGRNMQMALYHMWPIIGCSGLKFFADQWNQMNAWIGFQTARFIYKGTPDRIAIGIYNSSHIEFDGFFMDMQNCRVMLDGDMFNIGTTGSSAAITTNEAQSHSTATGPKFLDSLKPGVKLTLTYGGVGNTAWTTTLLSASDGQHATLAAPIPNTVGAPNNGMAVATSYSTPLKSSAVQTQTHGVIRRCVFVGGAPSQVAGIDQKAVAVAQTSTQNCEYWEFHDSMFRGGQGSVCSYLVPQAGGSYARAIFNFAAPGLSFAAPGGQILTGTNDFMGFTVDTFSTDMNGALITLSSGGAAGQGPGAQTAGLQGYLKYIDARHVQLFQDAALTNPLLAATDSTVAPAFQVGEAVMTGAYLGPAQNSKRHVFHNTDFHTCYIGIDLQGGSMQLYETNFGDNGINIVCESPNTISEPIYEEVSNSENSRIHLWIQSILPYEMVACRLALGYQLPGTGWFTVLNNGGGSITMRSVRVEGDVNYGCSIFNLFTSAGNAIATQGCHWAQGSGSPTRHTTLTMMGWNKAGIANGTYVHSMHDKVDNVQTNPAASDYDAASATLLPSQDIIYTGQNGFFSGYPKRWFTGLNYFAMQPGKPAASEFPTSDQWAWFDAFAFYAGGNNQLLVDAYFNGTGFTKIIPTKQTIYRSTTNFNFQVAMQYGIDGTILHATIAENADHNIYVYNNYDDDAGLTIKITNGTAGALGTITFESSFFLAFPFTPPGAGKSTTLRFYWDADAAGSGQGRWTLRGAQSPEF